MLNTDTLTTQQILTALLERVTFTNGLDHCAAHDVVGLRQALNAALAITPLPERILSAPAPYEAYGEALLMLLVALHTGDEAMFEDDPKDQTFYNLLDSLTDDEAEYYTECSDMIYFERYNACSAAAAYI